MKRRAASSAPAPSGEGRLHVIVAPGVPFVLFTVLSPRDYLPRPLAQAISDALHDNPDRQLVIHILRDPAEFQHIMRSAEGSEVQQ